MRTVRLIVLASVVLGSACTLVEGLTSVPTPIDGGTIDAFVSDTSSGHPHHEAGTSDDAISHGGRDGSRDGSRAPDASITHDGGSSDHSVSDAQLDHGQDTSSTTHDAGPTVTTLATGQGNPLSLTIYKSNAYWVNSVPDGSIMRVGTNGLLPPAVVTTSGATPFSLLIDTDETPPLLYFSRLDDSTAVAFVSLDGGAYSYASEGANVGQRWLALGGNRYVYWTNTLADVLYRLADGGGDDPVLTTLNVPEQLVSDSTQLYWVQQDSPVSVMKSSFAGDATVLSASGAGPRYLAVNGTNVYWTATTANEVRYAPKASAGLSQGTLVSGAEDGPAGIALDDNYVYWASQGGGAIRRAPLTGGGAATTLVDMQNEPTCIAVANGVVYWTNVGDGTVMSFPVPP
jgi:hypothetical protein